MSISPQLTYGTYYTDHLQTQTIDKDETVKIANLLNMCLIRVTKKKNENAELLKTGESFGVSPIVKQKINELLDELVKKFKIEEGIKSGVIVSYEELVQHINKYLFLFEKILYRHEKMCVRPSNTPDEKGKLSHDEVGEMFKKLDTYDEDGDVRDDDPSLKLLIKDLTELTDGDEVDSAVAGMDRHNAFDGRWIKFDDFYKWYLNREVPAPAIPEVSPFEVEMNDVFKENLRKLIYQIELDENMRRLFSNMKENDNDGDDEVKEPSTITKYMSGFVRVITSIVAGIVGAITAAGLWTGAIAGGAPVIAGIICCLFVIDLCIRPSKSYIARALQLFTITFRNLFSGIGEGIRGAVKSITKRSRGGYRSNRKKTNRKKTNRRKTTNKGRKSYRRKTINKGRKTYRRKSYRRKNIKKTTKKKNRRKNIKRTNQKTNKKVRKQ